MHHSKVRRFSSFACAVLIAQVALAGLCRGAMPTLEQKLDQYLKASQEVRQFTGAVLIAQRGKILYAKAYGMADIEKKQPNTVDTKFLIGSITKQFTATAIMQLEAKGKLRLDDPITKHLTDYPKETGDKITINELLTHTSGIPNFTDLPAYMPMRSTPTSPKEILKRFDEMPLEFVPGKQFSYSNSGYIVLGLIIEKVSGETYAAYLRTHIFEPLGMKNTGYMDYSVTPRAIGYEPDSTGKLKRAIQVDPSVPYAAGALYSTVGDMFIWDQALYGDKVLSQDELQKMWTPNLENYGYGWLIDTVFGQKRIWHNGAIDGFVSGFQRFVNDSLCIVMLSNNGGLAEGLMSVNLAAIMFHQPYSVPVNKTPGKIDPALLADYVGAYEISPNVYRLIKREGDTLYALRTGGPARRLYPETQDLFYYDFDNSVTLNFVRDSTGKVIGHQIYQNGETTSAKRLFGRLADSLLASPLVARVDSSKLDALVGRYQLVPQVMIDIRRKGDSLFAQITNQPELEIFPRSETDFFFKAVDAQITFVKDASGQAASLIVHQGGRDVTAMRVK